MSIVRYLTEEKGTQTALFAGLKLKTKSTEECVSIDEQREHQNITFNDDDALLSMYVEAAARQVEALTGRSLTTQTWELTLDRFPFCDEIKLMKGPVQSVTSITSYDEDNNSAVFSNTNYVVDTISNKIILNLSSVWPVDLRRKSSAVIEYVTGYGDKRSDVPENLRSAVKILAAHYYENREISVTGTITAKIPALFYDLISMSKRRSL